MTKEIKDKIITFLLILLVTIIVITGVVYLISANDEKKLKIINNSFKLTKGIVTNKNTYKGHFIKVKYIVNGRSYIESDGIDERDNINKGDSVMVKYSTEKPELMITQFNDNF
ncbi:hypothetical protein [Faecalibacter bovis]|uniref:DUF3592 domain-containing protein n=1 Tax=Faecalibacter bovis TaxID=2898187 RepID=A0ABX7XAK4_9FLAO|nr:hypothetical protein [Faecalibacter bovis]QTV04809.1 hypothetical protein J9309_08315 [Faecalibacter bovis]